MIRDRKIGPGLATVLVANNMIGSGIFLLPASLAAVGGISVLSWGIALGGALLVAAVLARLGQVVPEAGGLCAYAGAAFGPYIGFHADVIYWLDGWIGNIAIDLTVVGYLASFFPSLSAPLPRAAAAIAIIGALTLVNIFGPRLVCQLNSVMLLAGLFPIVLVSTLGWWYFDPQIFRSSWNVTHESAGAAVQGSLVLVFWAFLGLESASVASAVVAKPGRNVPIATIGGVLLAGIVYLASSEAIMGIIPASTLVKSSAPFADAMRELVGPVAAAAVGVMALLKALGTLCGWTLLLAQIGKAAAERQHLPAMLGRSDRHGVPVIGLVISAVLMSCVVLATLSPTLNEQFNELAEVSVILSLLLYAYACGSVWHYSDSRRARSRLGSYRFVGAAAILFSLGVIALSGARVLTLALPLALGTFLFYPLARRARRYSAS